ncbi:MAG TPA: hydantoinase/oxoprolinase family protein [Methylophilus sp.]
MSTAKPAMIGWDIGGAHLKAVLIDAQGVALQVLQLPCALWRGVHELSEALDIALVALANHHCLHAVTMTGELVDCFVNRQAGVNAIAEMAKQKLGEHVRFFAGEKGFMPFVQMHDNTTYIASMNWYASARFVAQQLEYGLFVDMGSTTTDVIPIASHQVGKVGLTDADRMAGNALVYTGLVRTPLMALGQQVMFKQRLYHVAAEHFATTADVYRLLGQLSADNDVADTADSNDKSMYASARRIARMIGHDVEDATMQDWIVLAQAFKALQLSQLSQALRQVLGDKTITIVGAGAGVAVVEELATLLHCPFINANRYILAADAALYQRAVTCFPAYAVARLAQ